MYNAMYYIHLMYRSCINNTTILIAVTKPGLAVDMDKL